MDNNDSAINSGILQVRVMDWITDSPSEQQAHVETTRRFSKIRHLEIRLTGWTINQNRRVHVGINTVPAILGVMMTNATMEELTIDLECLSSQEKALLTFCNLVTTRYYASLAKLTILCSGEEDVSRYSLRYLGRTLRNLSSVTTLRISGMNPDHLAIVLNNMKAGESCLNDCLPVACCPCVVPTSSKDGDGNGRPCPRILPSCCCDPYEAVPIINSNGEEEMITLQVPNYSDNDEDNDKAGCPQKLELNRIRLSHKAIATLTYLLLDASQPSVTQLTLRDCLQSTEDLGFLVFLCQGHSVLQELTLERHRIRSFSDGESSPWWNPCTRVPSPAAATKRRRHRRLKVARLLDCEGARKVLEEVTGSLVRNNEGLQRLVLQYSSTETCSMTIHALNALYVATVIHNKPSHLLQLQVVASSPHPESSYRLHQLAAFLGHPLCSLQTLQLHLGSSPYYQLDILGDRLMDNVSLGHLALSGDDELDFTTLDCFMSMLERIPKLTSLELDFPGLDEDDDDNDDADDEISDDQEGDTLLRIFERNSTLEDIRVEGNNDNARIHLSFMGLRNRIRKVLVTRQSCQVSMTTLWKEILQILLTWCESSQTQKRLTPQGRDLVVTSGLWFALVECPLLVVDMEGPLLRFHAAVE